MRSTAVRTTTAFGILALAMGITLAQVGEQKKSSSTTALRAKSILGAKVQLQGDATAGTIEDIVFDEEGVIDYFIVSNGGKYVTVPWEAAKFNFEKRTATINITNEQYQKIPTYTTEKYPEFYTPAYRSETYRLYNVTPERRFERRVIRK